MRIKFLIIIIALVFPNLAGASLNFGQTNRVAAGTGGSLANLLGTSAPTGGVTYAMWIYPNVDESDRIIFQKGFFADGTATAGGYDFGTGNIFVTYQFNTTSARVEGTKANFSEWAASKWVFVAVVFDDSGTATNQKLYIGDLDTPLKEPSSYVTQTSGSGTHTNDSSYSFTVGNHQSNNEAANERIATFMVWNRALTLGELRDQQFSPHKTSGNVLFTHLGFNGTGTQTDWSGNLNNGTVTGAGVAPHVPLGATFKFVDTTDSIAYKKPGFWEKMLAVRDNFGKRIGSVYASVTRMFRKI